MRKYPTESVEVKFDPYIDDKTYRVEIPTPAALEQFEFYLEPGELEFYNTLSAGEQVFIKISCNPFTALSRAMGRDRP